MTEEPSATLRHLLTEVNTLVDATEFPLTIPGSDDAVELRERLSTRIATHLLPRMGENSAPAGNRPTLTVPTSSAHPSQNDPHAPWTAVPTASRAR